MRCLGRSALGRSGGGSSITGSRGFWDVAITHFALNGGLNTENIVQCGFHPRSVPSVVEGGRKPRRLEHENQLSTGERTDLGIRLD